MKTASDSMKSIIGMEFNVVEIAKGGADDAKRKMNLLKNEFEIIEKRRAFLESQPVKNATDEHGLYRCWISSVILSFKIQIMAKRHWNKYASEE